MNIRLLLRVHYQVSRLGVFSILLDKCTSPQQSNYPETVAKRLLALRAQHPDDSDFDSFQINKESAKFAVAMAQALGFITQNCVWDWRGLATAHIVRNYPRERIDQYLNLMDEERTIYFKYFLESDGAALLEIGKRLLSWGPISRSDLMSPDRAIINTAFIEVWEAYRNLTTDMRIRMELAANIKEQRARPYTRKTLIHKAHGHVFPMVDMGLLERTKSGANEVQFTPVPKSGVPFLQNLVNALQSIERMEQRFSQDEYFQIYAETFNIEYESFANEKHGTQLMNEIKATYRELQPSSPAFVSIPAIADVIGTRMINRKRILIERTNVERTLDRAKIDHSKDIHFHVDKAGRRTFLSISDSFLKTTNS